MSYFTPIFSELLKRRSGDQVVFAALVLGELRFHMAATSEKNPLLVIDEFMDNLEAKMVSHNPELSLQSGWTANGEKL